MKNPITWVIAIFLVSLVIFTSSHESAAQGSLTYNPNLGTLPSAQGWVHNSNNLPQSNYSLDTSTPGDSQLVQGSTTPNGNVQVYGSTTVCFNFAEDEVTLEANLRVFSSGLVHDPEFPGPGSDRAGWAIYSIDEVGRFVLLFVGDSGFFILGQNQFSSGLVPFDSTDAFHLYRLVVDSSGASVFVDGSATPLASLDLVKFGTTARSNEAEFGDGTVNLSSNTALKAFSVSSTASCPVGGIAINPDLRALALDTPEPSSGNAGLLAGIAVAVAAAVVATGAAAWYARRRVHG